jgi:hypothetical protein
VTYKTGSGLDNWIYCTVYIHTVRDYRQYSAVTVLHTFQFTVAHALGFSVFTSCILATDLSQSHCHFNSHMKSSWYSLIHFLPFLLNHFRLTSPELDQIPIPSRLLHFTLQLLFSTSSRLLTVPSYNSSARTPRKTPSSVVRNACLLVRYLTMDVLLLSRARVLREYVYRVVA